MQQGTPSRKPLGLKSLHMHPCFCAARRPKSQSTNPNTWNPRVRCFLWMSSCHPRPATLVSGSALIGCRARAKLVPRRLRMHHDPGPTTHAVAALRVAFVPTRRRCACQMQVCMELCYDADMSSVTDAQRSARDGCVHRDERVKDGRDARAEKSDSLD